MRKFLILFLLVSCATQQQTIRLSPNRDVWIGRSEEDVTLHPVLATLPSDIRKTESGAEVRTFKNSAGMISNGGCSSVAGGFGQNKTNCSSGSYEVVCSHVFTIYSKKVANYTRIGQCSEEVIEMRPRNKDGSVVLLPHEVHEYERTIAAESGIPRKENCGFLEKVLAAQGCN